jgi:hypothetical protein
MEGHFIFIEILNISKMSGLFNRIQCTANEKYKPGTVMYISIPNTQEAKV